MIRMIRGLLINFSNFNQHFRHLVVHSIIKLSSGHFVEFLCRMGGIIPPVARDLHKKHIHNVIDSALKRAGMSVEVKNKNNVCSTM